MTNVKFLAGEKLEDNEEIKFTPGTFYLALDKNELWFDSPFDTQDINSHLKIIDQDTLLYELVEEIDNVTIMDKSAIVGKAILGKAILGKG
jgi:hypothetical protein